MSNPRAVEQAQAIALGLLRMPQTQRIRVLEELRAQDVRLWEFTKNELLRLRGEAQ